MGDPAPVIATRAQAQSPGAAQPAPVDRRSPAASAFERMLRWRSAQAALTMVVALVLVAMYAPFLCNDLALIWHDRTGWHVPAVVDLFNQWNYGHWYDLLFNLMGLEFPALIVLWICLRRWLSIPRRLVISLAIVLISGGICLVPMMPVGRGHAPIWRQRLEPACTQADYQRLLADPAAEHPWTLFAPVAHRYDGTYSGMVLKPPGTLDPETRSRFWLGTDTSGHDVLSQLIFGARISLTIGLVANSISLLIGTLIGAVSGYAGGWVDLVLQRLVEIMLCFPTFLLILTVVAMLNRDIFVIMTVIGLTGWAGTARLVRGEFLAQSVRDYVLAGESLGLSRPRIMFRHILPNIMTPLLITASFGIAGAVLSESGLSFLGLGDATVPSWGGLLEQGREAIDYGWLIYAPGLAVFALVTALNVLGDAMREAFDPKGAA